jgi:hypothetical protein
VRSRPTAPTLRAGDEEAIEIAVPEIPKAPATGFDAQTRNTAVPPARLAKTVGRDGV